MMNETNLLEPGFIKGFVGDGASSLATNPSAVFSFIWVFGVIACVVAAGFVMAYGGVKLTAATSSDKALDAKKDIQRAVYGLLGVLGLWLFINQINPDLLRGDIDFKPITGSGSGSGAGTGSGSGSSTPITMNRTITGARSHENIKVVLQGLGVTTNRDYVPCTETQRAQTTIPPCTDIQGLPDDILNVLRGIRQDCPTCSLVITGGTEPGHKTHGCNYTTQTCRPAIDLRLTQGDALWNIITNPANRKLGPSGPCSQIYLYRSARFCDETAGDRHWHVYR